MKEKTRDTVTNSKQIQEELKATTKKLTSLIDKNSNMKTAKSDYEQQVKQLSKERDIFEKKLGKT